MITLWLYRRIKLGPFSLSVPIRRRLPQRWSEVSQWQALTFSSCLLLNQHAFGEELTPSMKFTILNRWMRVSEKVFYDLSEEEMTAILKSMGDIFTVDKITPRLSLRIGWRKVSLPKELLVGETVEAFDIYEHYYQKILEGDKSEDSLILFCGYLLRSFHLLKWKRAPIDTKEAEKVVAWLKKKPYELQFYIYWWYHCTRAQLRKKYPGAFGKGGGKKGPDFTSQFGWRGLIYSVAQDGPFGPEKKLRQTEVHDFFTYLDWNHGRSMEHEWRMKQNKAG